MSDDLDRISEIMKKNIGEQGIQDARTRVGKAALIYLLLTPVRFIKWLFNKGEN